jgi:hypothetical protein
MNSLFIIVVLLVAFGLADATCASCGTAMMRVYKAVNNFCFDLKNLLPVAAMLMVVAAGVTYAAGQLMGAETRARANVWATAMLVGSFIALLIYAIAPFVLQGIYGIPGSIECDTLL